MLQNMRMIRAFAALDCWGRKERRKSGRPGGVRAAGEKKRAAVGVACGCKQAVWRERRKMVLAWRRREGSVEGHVGFPQGEGFLWGFIYLVGLLIFAHLAFKHWIPSNSGFSLPSFGQFVNWVVEFFSGISVLDSLIQLRYWFLIN